MPTPERIAVALSGGVDSRVLAHRLREAGHRLLALHASGPHVPTRETAWAQEWCQRMGIPMRVVTFDPLPHVATNDRERCYRCKHALYTLLTREAGQRILYDGSNADDTRAFRPGMRALAELGIQSPLATDHLSKAHIRAYARTHAVGWPDQPSRPCLITRFAYEIAPTRGQLATLERLEDRLATGGLTDFRLRMDTTGMWLQVPPAELALAHDVTKHLPDIPIVRATETISGYHDTR